MTDTERAEAIEYLRRAIPRIERRAVAVGPQHTGWDVVASIKHYTEGRPSYGFEGDAGLQALADLVRRGYPEGDAP